MKLYNIAKAELAEFYKREPGKESTDREMAKALYQALSTYGAQAEYVAEFVNDWLTAYHAAALAQDRRERSVYRSAMENTLRYCAHVLRGCGYEIDGVRELALHRALETTWGVFTRREREKETNDD